MKTRTGFAVPLIAFGGGGGGSDGGLMHAGVIAALALAFVSSAEQLVLKTYPSA